MAIFELLTLYDVGPPFRNHCHRNRQLVIFHPGQAKIMHCVPGINHNSGTNPRRLYTELVVLRTHLFVADLLFILAFECKAIGFLIPQDEGSFVWRIILIEFELMQQLGPVFNRLILLAVEVKMTTPIIPHSFTGSSSYDVVAV
ncbi:hypothetical protein DPX16_12632 [Anabarilius grahami]|uniref:Uncharacterized protein n=1 Tax=Anabarilius grahami TaxID=495550 RepID=A0A3N0YKQ7_ANAGA|nr:hypothetical protein DPX16_12632 [Anabarilius grahami]